MFDMSPIQKKCRAMMNFKWIFEMTYLRTLNLEYPEMTPNVAILPRYYWETAEIDESGWRKCFLLFAIIVWFFVNDFALAWTILLRISLWIEWLVRGLFKLCPSCEKLEDCSMWVFSLCSRNADSSTWLEVNNGSSRRWFIWMMEVGMKE